MPVFEGLLPYEDDITVTDMLFELANWHALAKLRVQHDITLDNLKHGTSHMYEAVRAFAQTTCQRYTTLELPSEGAARARRHRAKQFSTAKSTDRDTSASTARPPPVALGP